MQKTSWPANSTSVSQANPHFSCNPMINNAFYKSLIQQVSIEREIIPVETWAYFFQIHLPLFSHQYPVISIGSFPQVSPSRPVYPSNLSRHIPTHIVLLDRPMITRKKTFNAVWITNVPSVPSLSVPCNFIPPGSNYISQHHILINLRWISCFYPFTFIYFPFINFKLQPKNVQTVRMWWHSLSVKLQLSNYKNNYNTMITLKILSVKLKHNNLEYRLFIGIKIFLKRRK